MDDSKRLYGIRGASCAENTKESIRKNVAEMCLRIFKENGLTERAGVSVQFTQTDDLTAQNASAAFRLGQNELDVSKIALFTMQEPKIDDSPKKMIRVLVTAYLKDGASVRHVYINGAEKLRPDFAKTC